MGLSLETSRSHVFLDGAILLPDDREIAGHWAESYINDNPAYRWVVGKYVEADNPNSNNQMWTLDELQKAKKSITDAPMNILHRPQHIVGAYTGAEMNYPISEAADASDPTTHPYIGAVAAFWKYYYPTELAVVEMAFNEGSLFYSMECISDTITFRSTSGEEATFPYAGPSSSSYGDWNDRSNVRQLNGAHFLAGALIFPPAKPGWKGANIKELANIIDKNDVAAEAAYEMFRSGSPHLSSVAWEELMLSVMGSYS